MNFKFLFSAALAFKGLKLVQEFANGQPVLYQILNNSYAVTLEDGTTQNVTAQEWLSVAVGNVVAVEFATVSAVPLPANFAFMSENSLTTDVNVQIDRANVFSQSAINVVANDGMNFTIAAPAPIPLTPEQILADDKAKMALIVSALKNNVQIIDDDAIFYAIGGSSTKISAIMNVLDNGGGYPELVTLNTSAGMGLSDATILRIMSIYLVKVDTIRYQNEAGLALITNYGRLDAFMAYLTANSIPIPSLEPTLSVLRSNIATFNAARLWAATSPA